MNKGGSKGQTPRLPYAINVGGMVIMWLRAQVKVYIFVLKKPKSNSESYSKEEETYNESEPSEECDYYDGMTEGHWR